MDTIFIVLVDIALATYGYTILLGLWRLKSFVEPTLDLIAVEGDRRSVQWKSYLQSLQEDLDNWNILHMLILPYVFPGMGLHSC